MSFKVLVDKENFRAKGNRISKIPRKNSLVQNKNREALVPITQEVNMSKKKLARGFKKHNFCSYDIYRRQKAAMPRTFPSENLKTAKRKMLKNLQQYPKVKMKL